MKKVLVIAMMAFVMVSCSKSPEQIAQQLIKDSFTEDTQTAQFYEPVTFGTLDSVFTTLDDYEPYTTACKQHRIHQIDADSYEFKASLEEWRDKEKQAEYLQLAKEELIKKDAAFVAMEKAKNEFKPQFKGWKMNHKFNVNNGIVLPFEVDIYFNKELTEIVGRGEIK